MNEIVKQIENIKRQIQELENNQYISSDIKKVMLERYQTLINDLNRYLEVYEKSDSNKSIKIYENDWKKVIHIKAVTGKRMIDILSEAIADKYLEYK
ncbi:hypothetical protein L6C90_13505 [Staphylococcus aureus]|uniref:hypothetical protein n=1 Tax=Staphylococcus aureus TaxID=1280 RepID=UPI002148C3E4|nr:hypothetical protein [Staphylococcus aureus]MCE5453086.1 hypothetical protein [Staphylococcus pseudintermedius]MCQ9881908.1 hypothetical protein [Staphylococcus aureus]MCQ9887285.1 hypothetical protein [Staphylococcus aureus]MCQ9891996.1 hypothetical protein [Staphylococcus aureus]MCQ9900312.1 hypothetical protein [Staphylococcus aureus]